MTDPVTIILGGIVIAVVSGGVGKFLGSNNRVKDVQCGERREACSSLILEKIDHLVTSVDDIKRYIADQSKSM